MEVSFETIKGISFGVYTTEEIKKSSVLEITNPDILDSLGHPSPGGLHDDRLGPNERDEICGTCGFRYFKCPGHLGHISLPVPVYNPVFFPHLYQILRGSCLQCHRLVAPQSQQHLLLYQLQALDYGLVSTVEELAEVLTVVTDEELTGSEHVSGIKLKLKRKFEEAIQGLNIDDIKDQAKSVVECRLRVTKNFKKKYMMNITGKCPHCKIPRKKISQNNMRVVYTDNKRVDHPSSSVTENDNGRLTSEFSTKEIMPVDAKKHMHAIWENDKILLQQLYKPLYEEEENEENLTVDMFFMDVLIVPPSRFRRLNCMKGRKYADCQTVMLNEVLKDCHTIRNMLKFVKNIPLDLNEKVVIDKLPGKTNGEKFNFLYQQLQRHVNEIYDGESNKTKAKLSKGIKQILEKKEGLFRMNMMGKRVNYAARSVISPDPYICVNEIGIPMVFAKKLTYPEPVNQWNFEKLRRAVKNGPNVHPGAVLVEYDDGTVIRLLDSDPVKRQAMANTLLTPHTSSLSKYGGVKIVHRHLRDGDMLLLNRQPTLHKPSIMAHKARVLPGEKTLRLHYANCKSYNADFDGDEMNAHLPQSYLGQSECRHIVSVNQQYLVPKDGTPLSGLIQDHIISGTLLTMRGCFLSKDAYQQLLYSALSFLPKRLKLLPPAIIKPELLWSGKQLVSSIIINLIPQGKTPPTVEGKAKVSSKNWKNRPARPWVAGGSPLKGDSMSEAEVIIREGELLCGIIDKAQVGPTPYSLIHVCYELYGGEVSSTMLTAMARLFTHYLQYYRGFSLGTEDIIVDKKANKQRKKILKKSSKKGLIATAKALEVENPENPDLVELNKKYRDAHHNRDDFQLKMLDMEMKKVTQELNNDVKDVCMPSGLIKKFPSNNLQLMIESGAKGSTVNAMQISCLLGQIELEGRRMPLMLSGATLPSFSQYDTSPSCGGFVAGRFLTGVSTQEYYFHCMAGREGLIDTAVKTSRSGYLQRCLIKHLEGVTVNYDLTVRDCDGTVIQFLYGEDGLDVSKTQMLQDKSLCLLAQNYSSAVDEEHVDILQNRVEADLPKLKKRIQRWKKKHPNPLSRNSLMTNTGDKALERLSVRRRIESLNSMKSSFDERQLKEYNKAVKKCPDPVNVHHRPDLVFGSVSEKLEGMITDFSKKNLGNPYASSPEGHLPPEKFRSMCYYRALKSLAEPGETVGLLAAQSIGEPSTQMTLNTFHFAGKGEMNVTLGIPRIREILMTASANIATPTMDLPLLDKPGIEEQAEKLKLRLNPVSVKQVLDTIQIKEFMSIHSHMNMNFRNYVIRMNFLKHSEYKGYLYTTPSKILQYIEKVFIKKLIEAMKKKNRQTSSSKLIDSRQTYSGFNRFAKAEDESAPAHEEPQQADEGESSGDECDGEGDTTSTKSKMRHNQDQEYEDPEEEEIIPEESEDEAEKESDVVVKQEITSEDERAAIESFIKNVPVKKNSISDNERILRINAVKCTHSSIANYDFDSKNERWCEVTLQLELNACKIDMQTLLEEEVGKAYVHSIPHIKEVLLVKNPDSKSDCKMMLKTNGVNFLEIFKHVNILDINKAYSNNIHAIAEIYGIEAAARAIKKEIVNVFKPYGISVDSRHLSLISDYMTASGYYRPCNRIGMEGSSSPLQQMTFETTKNFLVDAMLMGVEDRIKGPSANIIAGQLLNAGTGSIDIFVPIDV